MQRTNVTRIPKRDKSLSDQSHAYVTAVFRCVIRIFFNTYFEVENSMHAVLQKEITIVKDTGSRHLTTMTLIKEKRRRAEKQLLEPHYQIPENVNEQQKPKKVINSPAKA